MNLKIKKEEQRKERRRGGLNEKGEKLFEREGKVLTDSDDALGRAQPCHAVDLDNKDGREEEGINCSGNRYTGPFTSDGR
ncbi:skin secretory protein xP2 [Iris pallida]|uniref:Skin secretory protein xP2 n=1 Tax=Iris pallida TaxID=29817 RepID=A0AAX6ES11_IRIPA|nr:skin secretory protein xP2 [Iris pallida]